MPSNLLIDSDIPEIDSREGRSSLLAQANTDELTSLVDRLLEEAELSSQLRIVRSPHTGTVQFQVREPVCEERFYLADVVVTVAEVAIGNHLGWAMRVGTDRRAALAAAVADALFESGHKEACGSLQSLITVTRRELSDQRQSEWAQLNKTIIEFEELD